MDIKDYAQMIGHMTRDKTTDVPGSMAHGLRNMKLAKAYDIPDAFNPDLEQSEILRPGETLEDWKPNPFLKPHAEGGRAGYNDGQLVTPNVDGSRPGYSGLPDFITKSGSKTNPYRVKVKKSKLNTPFSGQYPTLKKAKEVVKEKGFKKGTTGVQYPQLLEKAQFIVNDYNEIVDSAITNNDLRNVKYLETYVKDRFKKKSEQDQILRQIYKKKIEYRDLTEVRKKLLEI